MILQRSLQMAPCVFGAYGARVPQRGMVQISQVQK